MYAREVFESEIDIKFEAGTAEYFCKCRGGGGGGGGGGRTSDLKWGGWVLSLSHLFIIPEKAGGRGSSLRRPCEFFTRQEECVKVFKK